MEDQLKIASNSISENQIRLGEAQIQIHKSILNERKISSSLKKVINNHSDSIADNLTGIQNSSAVLKKLPLWGEKVSDDEIDFEWPTPEVFALM